MSERELFADTGIVVPKGMLELCVVRAYSKERLDLVVDEIGSICPTSGKEHDYVQHEIDSPRPGERKQVEFDDQHGERWRVHVSPDTAKEIVKHANRKEVTFLPVTPSKVVVKQGEKVEYEQEPEQKK